MPGEAAQTFPGREVHVGDGVAFAREREWTEGEVLVTSLPDVSELKLSLPAWKEWFVETARLLCEQIHPRSLAVFYQSDIKRDGEWVDKGYLVSKAAEAATAHTLFHWVVCRAPAGTVTFGRPAYSHLLAFSREHRLAPGQSGADVLPRLGEMTWPRAMGVSACEAVLQFLVRHTSATTVVDPFCGHGTILAVANYYGLHAVGAELSPKRARKALSLALALPPVPERRRERATKAE